MSIPKLVTFRNPVSIRLDSGEVVSAIGMTTDSQTVMITQAISISQVQVHDRSSLYGAKDVAAATEAKHAVTPTTVRSALGLAT